MWPLEVVPRFMKSLAYLSPAPICHIGGVGEGEAKLIDCCTHSGISRG
jgi:hypothetical protein